MYAVATFFTVLVWSISCLGQSFGLSGQVVDATTREPLEAVNVYLANTTIGSSTNAEGKFSFRAPEGRYNLIVSYVGYKRVNRTISISRDTEFTIRLEPEVKVLNEVLVEADQQNWENNYQSFLRLFVGSTENAAAVEIENARKLYFFFDQEEGALYASAKEPLLINNKALGYRIRYDLQEFRMDYKTGYLMFAGLPWFEHSISDSKRRQKRWFKNRKEAYEGSLNHFFEALRTDALRENNFEVREVVRTPVNRDLDMIRSKVQYFRTKLLKGKQINLNLNDPIMDSLRYWTELEKAPGYVDSLGELIQERELLMSDSETICCKKILEVRYLAESESRNFAQERRGDPQKRLHYQLSRLHFPKGKLVVYPNGYYQVNDITLEGYWEWSSKMAELLPIDYR